jgi:hypothetical protein
MADRAVSILLHGLAGAGKTRLGTSAPKPLLFIDVEKAARFIKGRKIRWNPLTETVPVNDGTWDICVVNVDEYNKAAKAYEVLKSKNHPFKSVLVDSLSELQAKAVEDIKGRQQFQTQDWGKLLSRLSFFCRDMRDLTEDEGNTIEAVIMTAMSKDYDGIIKPYLQGQIHAQVAYWMDITGYLYVQQLPDANGELKDVRMLLIGNHPNYEAKCRVPDLPPVIENPDVTRLLDEVFGPDVNFVQQAIAPTEQPALAAPPAQEVAVPAGMPGPPS